MTAGPPPHVLTAEELARSVAHALAEPSIRTEVRNAMRSARFLEHKLHFQRYIALPRAGEFLRNVAAQHGISANTLLERLRGFPDLEFYIPAAAQRVTWTGTEDLYVYALTRDESETPRFVTAFDPRGGSRRAAALEELQADAVFALVPVETDFSAPELPPIEYEGPTVQSAEQCNPMRANCTVLGARSPIRGDATILAEHDATFLTYFLITRDYDPWRGSMEIDVWVDQLGGGEECYRFPEIDEDDPWPGPSMHVTHELAQNTVESRWYEDDDGACEQKTDDDFIGDIDTVPSDLGTVQSIDDNDAEATFEELSHGSGDTGGPGCDPGGDDPCTESGPPTGPPASGGTR